MEAGTAIARGSRPARRPARLAARPGAAGVADRGRRAARDRRGARARRSQRRPGRGARVERTALRPGEIELTVRNDGPDPVEVEQVAVNDAYFAVHRWRRGRPARLANADDRLPVGRGGGVRGLPAHLHGGDDRDVDRRRRARRPASITGFIALMALLGIYVGVIPIAIGMLWLPFLRRVGAGLIRGAARVHGRAARVPRRRRAARGLRDGRRRAAGVRRRRARLPRCRRLVSAAGLHRLVDAGPSRARSGRWRRTVSIWRLLVADRDRHAQPRRGPARSAPPTPPARSRSAPSSSSASRSTTRPRGSRSSRRWRTCGSRIRRARGARADRRRPGGARRLDRRARLNPSLVSLLFGAGVGAIVQVIVQIWPGLRPAVGSPARRHRLRGPAQRRRRHVRDRIADQCLSRSPHPEPRSRPARERDRGDRGLREGDPRARRPRARARSATSALAERLGVSPGTVTGDAQADGRARPGQLRALPRRRADRRPGERMALEVIRHHRLLESFLAEALGMPLGPGPRRGRGARALHQRGPRGADRGGARRSRPRPARRPDPRPRPHDHRPGHPACRCSSSKPGMRRAPSCGSPTAARRCCAILAAERGSVPGTELRVLRREPFGGAVVVAVEGASARSAPTWRRGCSSSRRTRLERAAGGTAAPGGAAGARRGQRPDHVRGRRRPPGRGPGRRCRQALARRQAPRAQAAVAVPRPGLRRLGRLHRSRQLRDEHRLRRPVRLHAALGRPRGEPDRDGRADAVGEARDRHRQEPARALPCRSFPARPRSGSGSRPSSLRWRPTSPRSSAPRSASTCCSGSRCSGPA